MTIFDLSRSLKLRAIVGICLNAALLAACSSSGGGNGVAPAVTMRRDVIRQGSSASNYELVYSFGSKSNDGAMPAAGLILNGILYGTTQQGGTHSGCQPYGGCGTVFSIDQKETETVLHSFNGSDGASPVAGLRVGHHVLYGTTQNGGKNDTGTVFSITSSGKEDVLYSFGAKSSGDGDAPEDALVLIHNVLYGTTKLGGEHGPNGTVFSMTTSGTEKILHNFSGSDGLRPRAGLVDLNGVLYGTTQAGGANDTGTVFSITPGGKHRLMYSFGAFGSGDGERPRSGQLIAHDSVLYGTTERGGKYTCGGYDARRQFCGTVFSITTSGVETVLHSFGGLSSGDGAQPEAGLVDLNGVLYGTTQAGGANNTGTVFSITPSGTEKVVHSFGSSGSGDGAMPVARLVLWDKTLYGTTELGGAKNQGTVFSLTP